LPVDVASAAISFRSLGIFKVHVAEEELMLKALYA